MVGTAYAEEGRNTKDNIKLELAGTDRQVGKKCAEYRQNF